MNVKALIETDQEPVGMGLSGWTQRTWETLILIALWHTLIYTFLSEGNHFSLV